MRSTCATELAVFEGDAASRPSMAGLRKKRPFTTAETVLRTFEASGHLNLSYRRILVLAPAMA
jgi:hypothetical protein